MGCSESRRELLSDLYIWLCRIWGIGTAIGLWGTGIETAWRQHPLGIYLIILAALMSVFEALFIIDFWHRLCNRERSECCQRVWKLILSFDTWKKGAVYLFLAVGCFVQPHTVRIALISGIMVIVSSCLYFVKTLVIMWNKPEDDQLVKSPTYDRFDDLPEDLEEPQVDRVANQIVRSPSQEFNVGSLADQDQILEV